MIACLVLMCFLFMTRHALCHKTIMKALTINARKVAINFSKVT